jgi:hypothetical protein
MQHKCQVKHVIINVRSKSARKMYMDKDRLSDPQGTLHVCKHRVIRPWMGKSTIQRHDVQQQPSCCAQGTNMHVKIPSGLHMLFAHIGIHMHDLHMSI